MRIPFRFLALATSASLLAIVLAGGAVWAWITPQLPAVDALRQTPLQVPLRVYTRDGRLLGVYGELRRRPLRLEEIPEALRHAVIATEDEHFYHHPGFDWRGIARALLHLVYTLEKGPGGSTITMQVARNFFLGREKTYFRKLTEIMLALRLEQELTKDRILEMYLNKIFFGHRAYGVAAAAEVYYGKPLADLALPQIAMIAGLPQRPSEYNPIRNPARAKARRNHVLRRLHGVGHIDEATMRAAQRAPITASLHAPATALDAPYAAEMVRQEAERTLGSTTYTGAWHVHTTIDARLQEAAITALRETLIEYDRRHGYRGAERRLEFDELPPPAELDTLLEEIAPVGGLPPAVVLEVGAKQAKVRIREHGETILSLEAIKRAILNKNKVRRAGDVLAVGELIRVRRATDGWELAQVPEVQGAFVALDPEDGSILALTGGFDFQRSRFNRGTQALRQPGSSFKPFIYAAALAQGFTAASVVNDAPLLFSEDAPERNWRPKNFDGKFVGPMRLREGLVNSRNLVSIRLLREVGLDFTLDYLHRFGFDSERLPRGLSLALGSGEITPLEAATGYAVFANGGYQVRPWVVQRIVDRSDKDRFTAIPRRVCRECAGEATHDDEGRPVAPRTVPAGDAWIVHSILRDVVKRGTGRRALALKRADLAGKTGTTNDQRDAWFSGFVPGLVAIAWVGFDDSRGLGYLEVGGRAALPMWNRFMQAALDGVPEQIPPRPEGLEVSPIDSRTGVQLPDAGMVTRLDPGTGEMVLVDPETGEMLTDPGTGELLEKRFYRDETGETREYIPSVVLETFRSENLSPGDAERVGQAETEEREENGDASPIRREPTPERRRSTPERHGADGTTRQLF